MKTKLNPRVVASALAEPVAALLVAKTFAQVERERVDKIQRQVLKDNEFHGRRMMRRDGDDKQFRVFDPKDAWLMDDVSAAKYYAILNGIHEREGFEKAKEGHCPALTAEHNQTKAEWALIEASRQFFPEVDNNALLAAGGCEMRKKYLDLIIGLVLAAERGN